MDTQDSILLSSSCFHQSFPIVLTCLEFFDPEPVYTSLDYIRQILGHSSLEMQSGTTTGPDGKPGSSGKRSSADYALFAQSISQLVTQNGYLLCEVLLRRTLTDFPEDALSTVIILFRLLSDFFPVQLASWVPTIMDHLPPKVVTLPDKEKFLLALKQALQETRSELVKQAILDLVKSCRRERARERFAEEER